MTLNDSERWTPDVQRVKMLINDRQLFFIQEAQLSQRDRATFRVIEYFAKSLNVIRNDAVE